MITAVLFDLFETLITESGIQATRASSLATTLGLEKDAYRKEWKMRRPSIVRGQMSFAEALMASFHLWLDPENQGDLLRLVRSVMIIQGRCRWGDVSAGIPRWLI